MKEIEALEKIKKTCKSNNSFDCSYGNCPYTVKVTDKVVTYWTCMFSRSPEYWDLDKIKNVEHIEEE